MPSRHRLYLSNQRGGGGVQSGPPIFGKNDLTGGLTTGPDGKVQFSPYQGAEGFRGRWGRQQADELNRMIMLAMLEQQLAGENEIKVIEATGDQTRKNKFADVLTAAGLDPSDEDIVKAYKIGTQTRRIETEASRAKQERDIATSPEGKQAFRRGRMAQMIAPEVANTRDATISTSPGEMNVVPQGPGFTDLSDPLQMFGSEMNEQISVEGGITDPESGETIGGKPVVTRFSKPGFIRKKIPASIMDAIQTAPPVMPPVTPEQPQMPVNPPVSTAPPQRPIGRQMGGMNAPVMNIPQQVPQTPFQLMPMDNDMKRTNVLQYLQMLGF